MPSRLRKTRSESDGYYLEPELSQVMIEVEVRIAHAFGLGHFPKHGVRGEFAFPNTESLKQTAEYL